MRLKLAITFLSTNGINHWKVMEKNSFVLPALPRIIVPPVPKV